MSDSLIEKVTVAIYERYWDGRRLQAKAVIAIVVEEAAKVAEHHYSDDCDIARAIRALATGETNMTNPETDTCVSEWLIPLGLLGPDEKIYAVVTQQIGNTQAKVRVMIKPALAPSGDGEGK